ncbi:MAG TPA: prepilin-type N-terminal cleavage/methylation domain-containing protein [Phycisphaerales bacterium]|nr:prepilin-type N-terminal cleavage/methylation domain-containing protein [Phycisphaerales bacterium]HMP37265.1 prepilin-type N-terminal cleavage/methylation domain-containing protein [Phycisphaerales bacterium]
MNTPPTIPGIGPRARAGRRPPRGFTLAEMLVVVAVVAILVAILLPVYFSVRKQARSTVSLSNMRQWGQGLNAYAVDNKARLPWEGNKNANQMPANFNSKAWWGNAIPPYVGQKPYSEVSDEATAQGLSVPLPPTTGNIFIDPTAEVPANAPYTGGGKKFFFCYAPNAQLDNTLEQNMIVRAQQQGIPYDAQAVRMPLAQIPKPAVTVVMMELRTVKTELPPDDPFFNEALNRHYGDWQRFAARHRRGGHMAFADGSVRHVDNLFATTNSVGGRQDGPGFEMNKPDLVWDPLGPAFN